MMRRLLFLMFSLASCSVPKTATQLYVPAQPAADTSITFLVFNAFQRDSLSPLQVTHYRTYITGGVLKHEELPQRSERTTHIIQLQSPGNVPLLDLFLSNPMWAVEESFSETGRIEAHRVFSSNRTLSFRFRSVKGTFDHAVLYTRDSTGVFIQCQFIILNP